MARPQLIFVTAVQLSEPQWQSCASSKGTLPGQRLEAARGVHQRRSPSEWRLLRVSLDIGPVLLADLSCSPSSALEEPLAPVHRCAALCTPSSCLSISLLSQGPNSLPAADPAAWLLHHCLSLGAWAVIASWRAFEREHVGLGLTFLTVWPSSSNGSVPI